MTLDEAQDCFRNDGVAANAQAYLNAVIEYFEDDMIGEATFDSVTNELAQWCNDTGGILVDPRTGGGRWNG